MSSETYIIRISRSQYIERDRSIAILRLDQCQHYIGQPVQVRYYSNPEQTETDTVVAIGIDNGVGKDCYKVLSLGGLTLVRDVVLDPPDVSKLTHGEIYLCPDEEGIWSYMYEEGGVRQIEHITGGPFIFSNIEDKYRWFYRDGVLKREDDFNTEADIKSLLAGYEEKFENLTKSLEKLQKLVYANNTLTFPLRISFYDDNNTGGTHTVYRTGTRTGVNFVIRVTLQSVDIPSGDMTYLNVTPNCSMTLNGQEIHTTGEDLYTVEGLTRTTDYSLLVTYVDQETGVTKKGNAYYTVPFGYPFYYGVVPGEGWTIDQGSVTSLSEMTLGTEDTVIRFEGDLENQKVVIAVPTTYGNLKSAYDPGSSINCISDYEITTTLIDNTTYNVYVKELPITYPGFTQIFSFNEYASGSGSGSGDVTGSTGRVVTDSDLEALRQEILGGASTDYDTLFELEQKIKGISNREGLVAGAGIEIINNEDGSTTIGVNPDEDSIDTNGDNELGVTTVDGGYYNI